MKQGDTVYNIMKNKTFIVGTYKPEKNLVISTNMDFLFADQCQVIKRKDDRKGQNKSRSTGGTKEE